jgi:hypothetical protein
MEIWKGAERELGSDYDEGFETVSEGDSDDDSDDVAME